MNTEEIKNIISQIEKNQQSTQDLLGKLKKIVIEPKPQSAEDKKKMAAFYQEQQAKAKGFRDLNKLSGD